MNQWVHALDEGEMLIRANRRSKFPRDAARAGIETVYQDLALFDNLTPAENFFCGRECLPAWRPDAAFSTAEPWTSEAAAVIDA